ncbi:hypothetical protein B296_00019749 [Ensete ventricosum]|uniref:Uncharacterized protein n=1 Tax=Ensete ventricosum TaxID=4639 RepID=A0A426ZN45_ENSVE|nr:hypothetical protein B296_00019749 [Ensete ventricosum]
MSRPHDAKRPRHLLADYQPFGPRIGIGILANSPISNLTKVQHLGTFMAFHSLFEPNDLAHHINVNSLGQFISTLAQPNNTDFGSFNPRRLLINQLAHSARSNLGRGEVTSTPASLMCASPDLDCSSPYGSDQRQGQFKQTPTKD